MAAAKQKKEVSMEEALWKTADKLQKHLRYDQFCRIAMLYSIVSPG